MSSPSIEPKWFSSKNIASLQLYYESSLFTRMDLIPFLLLYAFDANVYFYPQIYKDFTQQLLNDYLSDYAHWNFQVYTWSLLGCWFAIFHAFCHVICTLLEYWHLSIRCKIQYIKTNNISKATVAHVIPPPHCGEDALSLLQKEPHDINSIFFIFQQIKYSLNPSINQFVELDFPTDLPIKHYIDPTPLTNDDAEELKLKYGPNEFNIPMPKFWQIFQEHATAPFFLFQIFCVGLWCLDEYWMYSLFTLFMLIVFEMMMVKRRMGNMKMIRNMRTKPFFIYIYRYHRWHRMSTTDIVPGDIISLVRCHAGMDEDIVNVKHMREETIVPCDVLLLSGSIVVDEALLTGESVPQIKEPIDVSNVESKLDLKSLHKISLISGGTKIVTSSFDQDSVPQKKQTANHHNNNIIDCITSPPNDGAVARVLTTGFHTSQGELLRTILFSTSRVSVNNPEAFVFIAILLCFAIVASGYVLYWGLKDETRSQYKLALNCIMIITSVVPPELPMELSLAVNNSMVKLLKQKIFCTEAFRIPFGGAVEVCCFDKTGTLTSDSFQVVGCTKLNIDHKTTLKLIKRSSRNDDIMLNEVLTTNAKKFAADSVFVIAGCHSLVRLEGKIIGDPLEKCALSAMGWSYANHCASPIDDNNKYPLVRIWHRFPFSSALKRMSCIVTVTKKRGSQALTRLVCKGAAETIAQRLRNVPSNYNAVHSYFSKQGFRVLGLAWKQLNISHNKLKDKHYLKSLKRNNVENDLIFGGFLVFACPHKPDSLDTIIQLKASSHAVIMITGDHVLTACAVAKDLYIATKPIISLQQMDSLEWKWFSIDSYYDDEKEKEGIDFKFETVRDIICLTQRYDICLSGKSIKYIRSTSISGSILSKLLLNVVIYARTSPVQKEFILSSLKELGITTLMCGDGTNDVGALKQAHVGVALLSATAARQVVKAEEIRRKKIEEKKNNTMRRFGMSSFVEQQKRIEREREEKEKEKRENDDDDDDTMSAQDLQKKMWGELMGQLEGDDDGDMMEAKPVQLGDASIASPFTSKKSSIEATIHIIRQGRCTLVTTLQMYSILALNCLISAYSLSVLYLEGVKFGDTQMTITGMMIAALFFFVTQSEPQFYLSEQQPHNSVFSPYIILSLIGQSITHLYSLMCAVAWSKPHTPTDEETRDPEGKFKPNVLNTVVFLVSTIQIVATFAANYAGYPFMQSLSDNKKLNRTILALCAVCFACGLGWWPSFDKLMQISQLPSDEFRSNLLILMAADLSIVVGWERLCRYFFRKHPNPIVPVTKPPKDIIKKAKKKQREKYLEQVKKQKELANKNSPWKMMKDMQRNNQQQTQTN